MTKPLANQRTAPGATLISGNGTANPSGLIPFANRLVYAADSTLGRELFQATSAPPGLTFASPSVPYSEGQPAKQLARNATLVDADSPVLVGGRLSVALAGALPGESLRILNILGFERQGNNVTSQGIVFGSLSPNPTTTSLLIDLNQNATLARTQLLIQPSRFSPLPIMHKPQAAWSASL